MRASPLQCLLQLIFLFVGQTIVSAPAAEHSTHREFVRTNASSPDGPTLGEDSNIRTYITNFVEGWRVLIDDRLSASNAAATSRALELLQTQLKEIIQKVPQPAVSRLRNVVLWFSPAYSGIQPKAEYHPGADWLREHGRNESMAKGVEFTNIPEFEAETHRIPNFTLHELAHAFHDRFVTDGFENEEIKTAFKRAKATGAYDHVERHNGDGRANTTERAYAMTNPMEYFAELTEAFFARNDFFPFNREELHRHDPVMEKLMTKYWGETNPAPNGPLAPSGQ